MSTRPEIDGDSSRMGGVEVTLPVELLPPRTTHAIPAVVGRYEVLGVIGEGAMGVVLRARDPRLRRVVALKLLRGPGSGAALEAVARRLRREAQALARLSHPHVVDVYDVGTADDQVFVAMEHVDGRTLDAWIAREHPERDAVLDAFVQAGRGLAAAHAAGLVHRDFKPANVLRGTDGRVRVVDFGLAAPPHESEVGSTEGGLEVSGTDLRLTATGMVMGTPAYMAPEAWRGAPADPRGDQYGFCVALFEALYGQRPFPASDVRELVHKASQGEPEIPAGSNVPAALRDVVLRGLRADPDARWPSMDVLLERLEQQRPRPSWRGWGWAGLVLAVAGAGAALSWPTDDARARCDVADGEVAAAWSEGTRARMRASFMATALPYAETAWDRARARLDAHAGALDRARREVCEGRLAATAGAEDLDRRAACLGQRLSELREVVAVLERADVATVRNASSVLGELRDVDACERQASAAAVAPPALAVAADVEQAREQLARARATRRSGDYAGARAIVDATLEHAVALGYSPLVAEARVLRSRVLEDMGEYEAAADELHDAVLAGQAADYDALVAEASTQLVYLSSRYLGRFDEAERWARHARAAIDRLPDRREAEVFLEGTLANDRWVRGELVAARGGFERALAAREQQQGPRSPAAILMRSNLALVLGELGEREQARRLLVQVLDDRIALLGADHPDVATATSNLAVIEQELGELDAAAEHGRHALAILDASVGVEHPYRAQLLLNLSNTEYKRGNLESAIALQEQARDALERSLGPRSVVVAQSLSNLGALYTEAGRYDEAGVVLRQSRERLDEILPPEHAQHLAPVSNLVQLWLRRGRAADAIAVCDEHLARIEGVRGPDHPALVGPLEVRAGACLDAGRAADAVADLRRAVALEEREPGSAGRTAELRLGLAGALWAAGEHEPARREAEHAQALVAPEAGAAALRAEVDAWLAAHPP